MSVLPHDHPPPADLSELAKEVWRRRFPDVWRLTNLVPADIPAYSAYCEAVACMIEADREFERSGRRILLDGKRNPMIIIMRQAREEVVKYAKEFGLTPASRKNIDLDAVKDRETNAEENDFAEFTAQSQAH